MACGLYSPETPPSPLATLVKSLQQAEVFDHEVLRFDVVETHISFILLTGTYAYKLKKPVDLGFLDFTTLALRKHYCEEELRLNRRLAPELYLSLVPITGSHQAPCLGGEGPAIEYAVKMRQFEETNRLDHLLDAGQVSGEQIEQLAADVAEFHREADIARTATTFGRPAAVRQRMLDNFEAAAPCAEPSLLASLRGTVAQRVAKHEPELERRRDEGMVRECHGDMHLANMVMQDGRIRLFDCLEFNPELRWVDVISEVAFAVMDLEFRSRSDLARRFLSRYLEQSGDYRALAVLDLYLGYRAMVRAKVSCLRAQQLPAEQRDQDLAAVRQHLDLTGQFLRSKRGPALILMYGFSGSGKSHLARMLVPETGAIRLRSDAERRRMPVTAGDRYSSDARNGVYARLADLAAVVIEAGWPCIVDATFLKRAHRARFRRLAAGLGVPLLIVACTAPVPVLQERVGARQRAGRDPSEASAAVVELQLGELDPLEPTEEIDVMELDTSSELEAKRIARQMAARLGLNWD